MPSSTVALAAPSRTPPPTMDPAEMSLGIPWHEPDSAHPNLDAHQISWVGPGIEVVDPDTAMVEVEQER
jgi:hypothetical protein